MRFVYTSEFLWLYICTGMYLNVVFLYHNCVCVCAGVSAQSETVMSILMTLYFYTKLIYVYVHFNTLLQLFL